MLSQCTTSTVQNSHHHKNTNNAWRICLYTVTSPAQFVVSIQISLGRRMTAVENKGRKDEEFEGGRRGGRAERLQNQSGDKIWAAVGLLGMDASCLPPYFCFFFLPLKLFSEWSWEVWNSWRISFRATAAATAEAARFDWLMWVCEMRRDSGRGGEWKGWHKKWVTYSI